MEKNIKRIIKEVRSGVCKIVFTLNNEFVNSGTGFMSNGNLITNNHVINPGGMSLPGEADVQIIFPNKRYSVKRNEMSLLCGSAENDNDYAVLAIREINKDSHYNFQLSDSALVEEGDTIVLFGYPFETENLSSHIGYISSFYREGQREFSVIQLDATVNNGNSGGPLLNVEKGDVIGIITRKHSGLYKNFDDLIQAMRSNIKYLESSGSGGLRIGNFDPVQGAKAIQTQMMIISDGLKRAANTGIGYAFSCDQLIREIQTIKK